MHCVWYNLCDILCGGCAGSTGSSHRTSAKEVTGGLLLPDLELSLQNLLEICLKFILENFDINYILLYSLWRFLF